MSLLELNGVAPNIFICCALSHAVGGLGKDAMGGSVGSHLIGEWEREGEGERYCSNVNEWEGEADGERERRRSVMVVGEEKVT